MSEKKVIGVLFCGGCNPYFDRKSVYDDIVTAFSDRCIFKSYNAASEGDSFDLILLINGCQSECLMEADYPSKLLVIHDRNYNDFYEEFQRAIEKAVN